MTKTRNQKKTYGTLEGIIVFLMVLLTIGCVLFGTNYLSSFIEKKSFNDYCSNLGYENLSDYAVIRIEGYFTFVYKIECDNVILPGKYILSRYKSCLDYDKWGRCKGFKKTSEVLKWN